VLRQQSAKRTSGAASHRRVEFIEHGIKAERHWSHTINDSKESWTKFLLSEPELEAYHAASSLQEMHRVGEIASIGVSIVTGANDYFTIDDALLEKYELHPWTKALLAKTNDSPGLLFLPSDHKAARASGKKAWILDFSEAAPDPLKFERAREYLRRGKDLPTLDKICRDAGGQLDADDSLIDAT
jgi:adenine-specific DNA-methyltransferase